MLRWEGESQPDRKDQERKAVNRRHDHRSTRSFYATIV